MCKDWLRKHQVWFLLPDAPVEKYLSTISTKVLGFTHWPGWSHMLMVQPGVWSTLVSLVLKLGGGTTHTNPMDWDRENNQLPEGISEIGNWMRTGRSNVCYITTPYIYHYITPHLLIQEKTLFCYVPGTAVSFSAKLHSSRTKTEHHPSTLYPVSQYTTHCAVTVSGYLHWLDCSFWSQNCISFLGMELG